MAALECAPLGTEAPRALAQNFVLEEVVSDADTEIEMLCNGGPGEDSGGSMPGSRAFRSGPASFSAEDLSAQGRLSFMFEHNKHFSGRGSTATSRSSGAVVGGKATAAKDSGRPIPSPPKQRPSQRGQPAPPPPDQPPPPQRDHPSELPGSASAGEAEAAKPPTDCSAADGSAAGGSTADGSTAGTAGTPAADVAQLRGELLRSQQENAELQRRLKDLEHLAAVQAASGGGGATNGAAEAAPVDRRKEWSALPPIAEAGPSRGSVLVLSEEGIELPASCWESSSALAELRQDLQDEQLARLRLEHENFELGRKLRNAKSIIKRLVRELEGFVGDGASGSGDAGGTAIPKKSLAAALLAAAAAQESGVSDNESVASGSEAGPARRSELVAAAPAAASGMSLLDVGSAAISGLSAVMGTLFTVTEAPPGHFWCTCPLGSNLELLDGAGELWRTIRFVGECGDDEAEEEFHAFACTAEPPLVDDGYAFEVIVRATEADRGRDELAIGFTSLPPSAWPEDLPATAEQLEGSWLVGYSGDMWCGDGRGFVKIDWSPPELREGDCLGVMASFAGQLDVFINGNRQWGTEIPFSRGDPPLYGLVDLLGAVTEVTLATDEDEVEGEEEHKEDGG